jgi:membrane protein implicated in regulation of membrane protease activity
MMLFLYELLPAALLHFVLIFGIIGSLLAAFVPTISFIGPYQWAFKVISVACLVLGLVWYGIDASESSRKAEVAVLNQKISQLESRAPEITSEIVTEYVDRVKIVKQKGELIVVKVPTYITVESDKRCPVPAGFVRLLNEAAKNTGLPDTTSGVDATGETTTPATGATGNSK